MRIISFTIPIKLGDGVPNIVSAMVSLAKMQLPPAQKIARNAAQRNPLALIEVYLPIRSAIVTGMEAKPIIGRVGNDKASIIRNKILMMLAPVKEAVQNISFGCG